MTDLQRVWRKRISVGDVARVVAVWPVLTVVHAMVRGGSLRGLEALLAQVPALWTVAPARATLVANRTGLAVQRARRYHLPSVKCLSAAATTTLLLRLRGVPAALVIGVKHAPFDAHAWTEVHGEVVGDRVEHVQHYAVVRRVGHP